MTLPLLRITTHPANLGPLAASVYITGTSVSVRSRAVSSALSRSWISTLLLKDTHRGLIHAMIGCSGVFPVGLTRSLCSLMTATIGDITLNFALCVYTFRTGWVVGRVEAFSMCFVTFFSSLVSVSSRCASASRTSRDTFFQARRMYRAPSLWTFSRDLISFLFPLLPSPYQVNAA
jgi:hypothetical protein